MSDDLWRGRLEAAVERDGRSMRDISLAARLSHGYLHGILRDNKEPTLDRFIRICKELDVSLSYALLGAEITKETETIVSGLESDAKTRAAILALLGRE
ncbi:helix-turn-helix domain-containing protein [Yoonia sp. R2331]|uniref:helix-turn-helix domain-containing protein n=1 Tax=Yoonia sp. R2331 TaxID=3237238 RepID=UPI0034E42349